MASTTTGASTICGWTNRRSKWCSTGLRACCRVRFGSINRKTRSSSRCPTASAMCCPHLGLLLTWLRMIRVAGDRRRVISASSASRRSSRWCGLTFSTYRCSQSLLSWWLRLVFNRVGEVVRRPRALQDWLQPRVGDSCATRLTLAALAGRWAILFHEEAFRAAIGLREMTIARSDRHEQHLPRPHRPHNRGLDTVPAGRAESSARRTEHPRRAVRRRRLFGFRVLRLADPDADDRPARRGGAALHGLPHHGHVLDDACRPADGPQSPLGRASAAWRISTAASPAIAARSPRRPARWPRCCGRMATATTWSASGT